jgi:hypothetical protein
MPQKIKPGGVNFQWDPVLGVVESYSSTCSHCQKITDFPSKREMMNYVELCRGCMKLICLNCVGKPCIPYEKQCEIEENTAKLRERIHMQGWKCY